jgi:hypothetical protein
LLVCSAWLHTHIGEIIIDASIVVLVCALAYTAGHLINKQYNVSDVNTSEVQSETN